MKILANASAKGEAAICTSIAEQVIQSLLNDGVAVEHAQKMEGLLTGASPTLRLTTPCLHLVNVSAYAATEDLMLGNASGYLDSAPRVLPAYRDIPASDTEQHFFVVGIEKVGDLTREGGSRFWSYSLVIPESSTITISNAQSKAPGERALCVALDLGFDGETYTFSRSRRIYLNANGDDRLATLRLPSNIYQIALHAAADGGCPITSARVNRSSPQERSAMRQARSYNNPPATTKAQEMVAAGATEFQDPFASKS